MKQPIYLLQALICGAVISFIDFRSNEVQLAALLIITTTFIFGALHARRAWVYALIIGLSIFVFHLAAQMTGWFTAVGPGPIPNFSGLFALIAAFIGAYCGAGLRWVLDGFNQSAHRKV